MGDLCRGGKLTLRWILEKQDVQVQTELIVSVLGLVVAFCDSDKV